MLTTVPEPPSSSSTLLSFIVGFQKGRSGPGTRILDSGRSLGPWCFPVRQGRVFVVTACYSSSSQFFDLSFIVGFQKGRSGPGTRILDSVRPLGPWCFPVRQGRVFVVTAAYSRSSSSSQLFDLSFIVGFQKGRSGPGTRILDSVRPLGPWCFPVLWVTAAVGPCHSSSSSQLFIFYCRIIRRDVPAPGHVFWTRFVL